MDICKLPEKIHPAIPVNEAYYENGELFKSSATMIDMPQHDVFNVHLVLQIKYLPS